MDADLLFRALSDGSRRGIFERLCRDGELSVHALTDGAGISQPAVSKHLALLREAGLVASRAQGREVIYAANPAALAPVKDWIAAYSAFWNARIDALTDLLKRMDQ